jgi:DNA-binding protein
MMDSSQYHGNLPIKTKTEGMDHRLSLVFYLRERVVEKSLNTRPKDVTKAIDTYQKIMMKS